MIKTYESWYDRGYITSYELDVFKEEYIHTQLKLDFPTVKQMRTSLFPHMRGLEKYLDWFGVQSAYRNVLEGTDIGFWVKSAGAAKKKREAWDRKGKSSKKFMEVFK